MTPRALLLVGSLVILVALSLAATGAAIRGSHNPECPMCAPTAARALFLATLPVAVAGGLLVAMGLARREAAADEAAEAKGPK